MTVISGGLYTRSAALGTIAAFLAGTLDTKSFRDWIDACDWDVQPSSNDPALRRAMARLELAFHEIDDGSASEAQARETITSARRLLS